MDTMRGESGVIHTFTKVVTDSGVKKVVDEHPSKINEIDILRFYIKALDVGVHSREIVAPSWTAEAQRLAKLYGIELKAERTLLIRSSRAQGADRPPSLSS